MTDQRYTIDRDNTIWSPERSARHDEIVSDMFAAAANVPREYLAVIAGGQPGAGKTTVLGHHSHIDRSRYLTINPDDIKYELACRGLIPDLPGLSPMEASGLAHSESSYLAKRLAIKAVADGKNLIWDVSMSSVGNTLERISDLRSKGYHDIESVFTDVAIDVSVARATSRHRHGHDLYLAGSGLGERLIPAQLITSRADPEYGSINRRVFETLKDRFTRWTVYDNSIDNRPPILVERGVSKGRRDD